MARHVSKTVRTVKIFVNTMKSDFWQGIENRAQKVVDYSKRKRTEAICEIANDIIDVCGIAV